MTLEHLWAGWRREYVASVVDAGERDDESCVFCRILALGEPDATNGIVWRDELTFAVLNAYPYASGHLLVMPVRHVSDLKDLTAGEGAGLWKATLAAVAAINSAYNPDGINMGANLGRAAGAGIPRHVHLHVLPRWAGDTNFMTSVAGLRVMPESLPESWRRLHEAWDSA
ncbi:MAG TPA: HIT domain-containing protein [Acidimicrobiales bacterium]|nr:HIT domain-containing protein [Acidimicrobiales bacterium]